MSTLKSYTLLLLLTCLTMCAYGQNQGLKLNHFYIVVDSMTFEALKENKTLDAVINIDKGLPDFEPIDSSTTTIYLRGASTYIEIMGPDNKFKKKPGAMGIGFSWDSEHVGDTIFAEKERRSSDLAFEQYHATKTFHKKKVPWYTAYYTPMTGDIATWYAFYHPEFLTNLYAKPYDAFRREAYLAAAYAENKSAKNVSSLEIRCSPADYQKIAEEFHHFHIAALKNNASTSTYALGDVTITLIQTSDQPSALKRFTLIAKDNLMIDEKIGSWQLHADGYELRIDLQ